MPNIIDILARALSLRQETALNSITPNRAGGIMYDTLLVLNQMQLEGGALLISKVYASVSAMEADTTPTSDLTGRALKPGQLVVIVTSDSSSSDMGSEYRFNGPGSWTYVGKVGGLPLDTVPTQSSTKGITSGGVYTALSAMKAEGYKYMGIATPGSGGTAPGTPNQPVFYIAGPGSYPNFGSITVASGYLGFIKYSSGSWSVESVAVGKDYDAQISTLDGQISQLEAKVTELSAEEALDLDEEIKVLSEDGQTTILEITEDGVDAKDLKSNGVPVLTSHQDISGLATKTELEETETALEGQISGKQDIIPEISIDDTQDDGTSEHIWSSDDGVEEYAKVTSYGLFAKNFPLYGKKWAVLGDSFTAGDGVGTFPDGKYVGKPKTYPYLISLRTGIKLYNFFGGGRTLAFPEVPGDFVNSVTNPTRTFYYQNIPADTDIITIYLGINDSHHAPGSGGGDGEDNTGVIPIGTITDNTTATYYGAWNVVLSWLIENRPFAHIGIIVSNGCDTADYRTAQIAIARKYGIPFIDLNGDDRTPFMLRAKNTNIPGTIQTIRIQKQAVDYDGTKTGSVNWHPNDDAHLFESTFIENFLRTI